jgi:hypothetical protein
MFLNALISYIYIYRFIKLKKFINILMLNIKGKKNEKK